MSKEDDEDELNVTYYITFMHVNNYFIMGGKNESNLSWISPDLSQGVAEYFTIDDLYCPINYFDTYMIVVYK